MAENSHFARAACVQFQKTTTPFRRLFHPVHLYQFSSKLLQFCCQFIQEHLNGGYHPTRAGSAESLSVGPSGRKYFEKNCIKLRKYQIPSHSLGVSEH